MKPLELSAIASTTCSLPTISMKSDCRAGISIAAMMPPTSARAMSQAMVMCPDHVNHQSSAAWTSISACAMATMRSR